MKNLIKLILSSFCLTVVLFSCKKDENKVYFEGGTAPVLTTNGPATMVLDTTKASTTVALTFNWTNPNYKFNTGPSSQDVTYILQIDTTGANFTNPNIQEVAIAAGLSYSPTVKVFNGYFNKMELMYNKPHNIEFRIKATLAGGIAAPLYSNVIKMVITPYLDFAVEPPGTAALLYNDGTLWATGDAFASGWSNPLPVPYATTQKFTRIDVVHYSLIATFNATGGYKLIQTQGNWDTQYHALAPNEALSGTFEKKNSDPQFPSPGVGTYKIEVNFLTGKYTLTKQ